MCETWLIFSLNFYSNFLAIHVRGLNYTLFERSFDNSERKIEFIPLRLKGLKIWPISGENFKSDDFRSFAQNRPKFSRY